jgi:hypothetical protein
VHPVITRRDLLPPDLLVLRDLVRFGILAFDQIVRRYGSPSLAAKRIRALQAGRFIHKWLKDPLQGTKLYTASVRGTRIVSCRLSQPKPRDAHLAHDVAVVDLADYLLAHEPGAAEWLTEREVRQELRQASPFPRQRRLPGETNRTPDGLLLTGGQRWAIELEHSDKFERRYYGILRWYASALRLDGVRWYVDKPKIRERLIRVNEEFGFDRDIPTEVLDFPPGVVVRQAAARFEP